MVIVTLIVLFTNNSTPKIYYKKYIHEDRITIAEYIDEQI
jgi:hypothetical protein